MNPFTNYDNMLISWICLNIQENTLSKPNLISTIRLRELIHNDLGIWFSHNTIMKAMAVIHIHHVDSIYNCGLGTDMVYYFDCICRRNWLNI